MSDPTARTPRTTPADLAKRVLRREWDNLSARERRIIESVLQRTPVARDVGAASHDARSFGERMADGIAAFGGSWTFILSFLALLAAWAFLNTRILGPHHEAFDPYPYIFLNLLLSMLAALQAPVIMTSQNRQAARDRLEASHDYEVNLKAELEIRELREALDVLRERQWADLVAIQQEQIRMLESLVGTSRAQEPGAG